MLGDEDNDDGHANRKQQVSREEKNKKVLNVASSTVTVYNELMVYSH